MTEVGKIVQLSNEPSVIQEPRLVYAWEGEIERLKHDIERHVQITTEQQAEIGRLRAALKAVQDWESTLPNAAGIPGYPKDDVDAALLHQQITTGG